MSRPATKAQLARRAKIHAAAIATLGRKPGRPPVADKRVVLSMRLTAEHKAELLRRKASGALVAWLEGEQ